MEPFKDPWLTQEGPRCNLARPLMPKAAQRQPLQDGSSVNAGLINRFVDIPGEDDSFRQESSNDEEHIMSEVVAPQTHANQDAEWDLNMLVSENSNIVERQVVNSNEQQRPSQHTYGRSTGDNAAENPGFAGELARQHGELKPDKFTVSDQSTETPNTSAAPSVETVINNTAEKDQAANYPYFARAVEDREAHIDPSNLLLVFPNQSRTTNTIDSSTNLPDISLDEALANIRDDDPFYNALKDGTFDVNTFYQAIQNGDYDNVVAAMFPTLEDAQLGDVVFDPVRDINMLDEASAQQQLRDLMMEVDVETRQNAYLMNHGGIIRRSNLAPLEANKRRAYTLPSDFRSSLTQSECTGREVLRQLADNEEFIAAGRIHLQLRFDNNSSTLQYLSSLGANGIPQLNPEVEEWLENRYIKRARTAKIREVKKPPARDHERLLEYCAAEEQSKLIALENLSPEDREKFDALELFGPGVTANRYSLDDIIIPPPAMPPQINQQWCGEHDFFMTNEDFEAQFDFFDENDTGKNDSGFVETASEDLVMQDVNFGFDRIVENDTITNCKPPGLTVVELDKPSRLMGTAQAASEDHAMREVDSGSGEVVENLTVKNSRTHQATAVEHDQPVTNPKTPDITVVEHDQSSMPMRTALDKPQTLRTTTADSRNCSPQPSSSFKTATAGVIATKELDSDDEVSLIQTSPGKDLNEASLLKSAAPKSRAKEKSTKNIFAAVKGVVESPKEQRAPIETHSPAPGSSWSWGQSTPASKAPRAIQPAASNPGDSEYKRKKAEFVMVDPSTKVKPASRPTPKLKSTYKSQPRQASALHVAPSGPTTRHQSQMMLSSGPSMTHPGGIPANVNMGPGPSMPSQMPASSSFGYQSKGLSSNSLMGPVAFTSYNPRANWSGHRNRALGPPQLRSQLPHPNNRPLPQQTNRPGLRNRHSIGITQPHTRPSPAMANYGSPPRQNCIPQNSPLFSPTQIHDSMSPTPIRRPRSTTNTPISLYSNPSLPPRPDFSRRAAPPRGSTPPQPDNTPLKLHIPQISPSRVTPRESATVVFGTLKDRQNAVRVFEEERQKTPKGQTMLIVETFALKQNDITVSGPAGSNVRGFVTAIFKDADISAATMG
jgi:hypothetical protein